MGRNPRPLQNTIRCDRAQSLINATLCVIFPHENKDESVAPERDRTQSIVDDIRVVPFSFLL